jgi:cation diffusion facilitator family transporter
MDEAYRHARRAPTISLAINGALAVVKLVTGLVGQSYALVADAIESLGDVFASVIVWGGLVIASKPADENHPYGHGKAEPLASLVVALMLIAAAVLIGSDAINEIRSPQNAPAPYTLVVLIVVVIIKESMCRYELRVGQKAGSTAVMVDAWHHRSDALTSTAAAVGIAIALIGGTGYEAADDWAALIACLVIVLNGSRFARTAIHELMDTTPSTELIEAIQKAAVEVERAIFVEKVLVRKMGPMMYVDLHLEVDPSMSVRDAHETAHEVKDLIMARWPRVADVLVHVEPHRPRS